MIDVVTRVVRFLNEGWGLTCTDGRGHQAGVAYACDAEDRRGTEVNISWGDLGKQALQHTTG